MANYKVQSRTGIVAKDKGAIGNGSAIESTAIQDWVSDLEDNDRGILTPGLYLIDTPIILPSNIEITIERGATFIMSTRLDYLFHADGESNIRINGHGRIRGTNTSHPNTVTERLFYFVGCDDVKVRGVRLAETIIAAQFQSCTDWEFDAYVRDILTRTDNSQGYGILANLDNSGFRVAGQYTNIARHGIYLTSGTSNGVVGDFVINGCDGAAVSIYSDFLAGQNPCRNIAFGVGVIKDVGRGSAQVSQHGVNIVENVENINLGSSLIIDNCGDRGISVEGNSFISPASNPRRISIGSPTIDTTGSEGIRVVNASEVSFGVPIVHNAGATGIMVSVAGSDIGSFTDNVTLKNYQIENPGTAGINLSGDAGLTNIVLGKGTIVNPGTIPFNIPATNTGITFDFPHDSFSFYEAAIATSATNAPFSANPNFDYWVAPTAGYITELLARISGSIAAGTCTITLTKNGSNIASLQVVLSAGEVLEIDRAPVGAVVVAQGDLIGVSYTTDGTFAPNGTRNCQALVRMVRT